MIHRPSESGTRLPSKHPSQQFVVGANIIKKDGFLSLYKGLDAGLLRQATYTTARLGIFNNISVALKEYNGGKVNNHWVEIIAITIPIQGICIITCACDDAH